MISSCDTSIYLRDIFFSLFQNPLPLVRHKFQEGMKLEAIHPHNRIEICPATVVQVFDAYYFMVQVDSHATLENDKEFVWLCTASHPYIFPIGKSFLVCSLHAYYLLLFFFPYLEQRGNVSIRGRDIIMYSEL